MMRELTSDEVYAALYLCQARHQRPHSHPICPACRADVVRLVDAPALPVPREGEAGTAKVRWQDDKRVKAARETVIEGLRDGGYCLSAEDIADALCAAVASLTASEGTSDA